MELFVNYESELRADFQQFYNLDIDGLAHGSFTVHHAACLCEQLPHNSRIVKKLIPERSWDIKTQLLANTEYWAHCCAWAQTKDAQHNRNKPKPISPDDKKNKNTKHLGVSMPVDELDKVLGRRVNGRQ